MHSSIHIKSRTALVLALSIFTSASLFAQGRKAQKIEFSEPSSSSIVVSNLDQETTESQLKPLPKPVFKPSDFFPPQENTVMPIRPPFARPRMDRKTMEMLEQRRNWAFTDSEALSSDKNLENMFGIKDGTDNLNKSQTSVEKYYESLDSKRKAGASYLNDILDLNQAKNFGTTNGMPVYGQFQSENDLLLKRTLSPAFENSSAPKQGGSVATFATPVYIPPSQNRDLQQQAEFRKLLSQAGVSPTSPALASQTTKPNSGLNTPGLANSSSAAEQQRNTLNPFLGVAQAPVFRPEILRDPTAKALGLPDPFLLPKPEVKKTPPPSPLASPLPVRKF
jgi:hypothetical protein